MSTIRVTYGQVTAAAADVRSTSKNIHGQLENLQAKVKQVADSWEGETQQAYQHAQARWDANARELANDLESIAKALESSVQAYQASDKKGASPYQ